MMARAVDVHVNSSTSALAGLDHQMPLSSGHSQVTSIDHNVLRRNSRSESLPHTSNEDPLAMASSVLATSLPAHAIATTAAPSINELGNVPISQHTEDSGKQFHRTCSCFSAGVICGSLGNDARDSHFCSMPECSASVIQSNNTATPNSSTEGRIIDSPHVDTLFKDDILQKTIPVVRDVLQSTAKGLDGHLVRDNPIVNNAPQVDARGAGFTDVARDQHNYYINISVCPRASSSTASHKMETADIRDDGLLGRGIRLIVRLIIRLIDTARSFIATNVFHHCSI